MVKKRCTFTFSEAFHEALQEYVYSRLVQVRGADGQPSVSSWIESYITGTAIIPELKNWPINPAKKQKLLNDFERACKFWLALRKAEQGVKGYEIKRSRWGGVRPKELFGKMVIDGIQTPDGFIE